MIITDNLSKSYDKGRTRAVDSINLRIASGEIFGFIGPNGAGKSTTIKILVGLLKPSEGSVMLDRINMWENPLEAKKKISYVPDQPEIYPKLKGIEYLNFIADIYEVGEKERRERIEKYTKLFKIDDSLGKYIESYSHGMKQKIVITGALLHDPDILILDEPMVGLDPKSSFNLKKLMKDMKEDGKTIFFSTHVLEVAQNLCSKIGIISKGKIVRTGTMEDLVKDKKQDESLENIFLELTEDE